MLKKMKAKSPRHRLGLVEHGIAVSDVAARMKAFADDMGSTYRGARVRLVLCEKQDGGWALAGGRVDLLLASTPPIPDATLHYGDVILIDTSIEAEVMWPFLRQLVSGDVKTKEGNFHFMYQQSHFSCEQYSARSRWGLEPCSVYRCSTEWRQEMTAGAIAIPGLPFFPRIEVAAIKWLELGPLSGHQAHNLSTLYFVLPQNTAYIESIAIANDRALAIQLRVAPSAEDDVLVAGCAVTEHSFAELKWVGDTAPQLPVGTLEIYLWVVDKQLRVFDFHFEDQFTRRRGAGLLSAMEVANDPSQAIVALISQGEGTSLEFREAVNLDDIERVRRVANVVVAFANTEGGVVLIGVGDYGEIKGVDSEARRFREQQDQTMEQTRQRYIGAMRSKLNALVAGDVRYEITGELALGMYVVRIAVQSNADKAVAFIQDQRTVFVRKNASTMRADPKSDLPRLYQSSSLLSLESWKN